MVQLNKSIDTYIQKAQPFAQPILKHLRKLVHKACPDAEEVIRWGAPFFQYKGLLCGMASFQKHCVFVFWKSALMQDPHSIINAVDAMGHLGRMTSLEDLPADNIIIDYIKEAMQLNDKGIKLPRKNTSRKKLAIPDDFTTALKKNKKAFETFENFPYSKKKDYIEWITEAKQPATREKRLVVAVKWLSEGKSRHWKYE